MDFGTWIERNCPSDGCRLTPFDGRESDPQEPIHRLLWAVLEQAVRDLHVVRTARGWQDRRVVGVERWFRRRRDPWPYSFEHVCAGLGLDPQAIRQALHIEHGVERPLKCTPH